MQDKRAPNATAHNGQDSELFLAMIKEFRPALVHYFARRVSAPAEAEDLAHDVFVRLMRRGDMADVKALRGYVFETANSVLIDWLRRRAVRADRFHVQLDDDIPAGADFEIERVLVAREELVRVTASLLELPERTRAVFVLRRFEGMKYKDIADRLGLSVSAVEKHMRRAMTHVLGKDG